MPLSDFRPHQPATPHEAMWLPPRRGTDLAYVPGPHDSPYHDPVMNPRPYHDSGLVDPVATVPAPAHPQRQGWPTDAPDYNWHDPSAAQRPPTVAPAAAQPPEPAAYPLYPRAAPGRQPAGPASPAKAAAWVMRYPLVLRGGKVKWEQQALAGVWFGENYVGLLTPLGQEPELPDFTPVDGSPDGDLEAQEIVLTDPAGRQHHFRVVDTGARLAGEGRLMTMLACEALSAPGDE